MPNFYRRLLDSEERYPQVVALEMQRLADAPPGHSGAAAAPERYTYSELRRMSDAVGAWLRREGLSRGARCALLAQNSPRWVAAYLGVVGAGCAAVPLDTAFHADQVAKLLADSGSSLLFTDTRNLAPAHQATQGTATRLVVLDGTKDGKDPAAETLDTILAAGSEGFTHTEVVGDETAAILYTSGTTSDPKGVILTHDNLEAEVRAVSGYVRIGPDDALLGVLPLFHALAQMANLLLPIAFGSRVVYLESLNTTELLRGLRERNITVFCCVPQFFYLLHERVMKEVDQRGRLARFGFRLLMALCRASRALGLNLGRVVFRRVHEMLGKHMRYMVTGGSRFDPGIGRDLHALGFEILQAYGLTETSGGAVATSPDDNVIGSVGTPFPGVEVKILNPQAAETGGTGVGEKVGEIAIRGGIVMKGYYNRPDATAEVLRDGWLHTGDLGYFDSGGHLFITGRQKEVIVLSSGKNVYPEEIEAHYQKSPYIKEICVMGLENRQGEPVSERLHAVVVPNFDLLRQRKIVNTREVLRFDIETLSAQLPSTKRILSYEIWQQELPRTTTRKLKRYAIERRVREQQAQPAEADQLPTRQLSDEEQDWLQQPDVSRALKIIHQSARNRPDRIHPADNLELDLGLDSMERVELLVALERELGANVDESVISQVYTVRELVDAVRGSTGGGKRAEFPGWEAILATEPTEPEVVAVTRSSSVVTPALYLFGRIVNMFARDFFRLRVSGAEKLPETGPLILAPNHQSFLDPPVLMSLLPWRLYREVFFVGTSEIFGSGFMRHLARWLRLVPVDPDSNLVPAMRAGAYGLRRGKILVLYPEGERSIDGTPKTFKKGAAILSMHLKVPIYPVALEGFQRVWPRGKAFQGFFPLKVQFGDPIHPPENPPDREAAYTQLTAELKRRVAAMWEKLHQESEPRAEKKQAAAAD